MSKYKAIVTTAGAAKIAAASAGGKQLKITHMAVGDGNGTLPTPNPEQIKLVNEKYRATLNTLTVDRTIDNHIIAELIIPANVGGFWLREMGLFDDTGALIAVSNMAESYKPQLNEGSGRTQTLRMVLIVSSTEAIQLIAGGDTVLATRDFVDDAIKEHEKTRNHPDASTTAKGFVQLSSATTSSDETKAATPKAIKDVNDASVKKADNLSDLKDKAAARKNLALGTAATKDVGTGSGNVMEMGTAGLGVAPIAKTDAYSNIAQFYRVNDAATNKPPITGTAAGVVCLPIDGAPSAGYLAISIQGDAWIGRSGAAAGGVTWTRIFTEKYPPTALGVKAADWTNNFAARMGISRVLTGNNAPTSAGVWSVENSSWAAVPWGSVLCTTNGSDLSTAPGNGKFQHYLQLAHEAGGKPGLRAAVNVNGTFSGWDSVMMSRGGTFTGVVKTNAEIQSTSLDNYRLIGGDYGSFWRNDGNALYLMLTNAKDQYGTWNSLRPFTVDVKTGQVTVAHAVGMNNNLTVNGSIRGDKNVSIGEDLWVDRNANVAGILKVGASTHSSDGNIMGSRWGNKWLWDAIVEQDNGRVDWGTFNREVGARATIDFVNSRSAVAGGRNGWWYKDEVTGLIFQGGVVNRADYATWVGFPRGYARECFGVQMTLAWTNGSWFGDSRVNIQARDVGNGGFNAYMDGQEQSAFWWAVGV
ncbi:phage tail protein [Serratia fonticola]|uniref:phage tail protein n=1 Tax=Serratia fonticola TaxID=47917 RepID=UPI000E0F423B|nr:phage tail protein [Serratia fonticola]RDL25967.1 phage-related tail fiber protein [Serratia fonticola]